MSDTPESSHAFEPAELVGLHYRSIGGSYGSTDLAIEAVKSYNKNKHGGGASCHVYASSEGDAGPSVVEFSLKDANPLTIQSIYKLFVRQIGS